MQIAWFGIGTIQLCAVFSCAHGAWGWNWFGSALFAAVLSYLPLIGSIAGVYGAMYAWNWPWWGACLLFFWLPVLCLVVFIIDSVANRKSRM
jgi:hypothetical protein